MYWKRFKKDFAQESENMELSVREIQILEFLCYGDADKEIAYKLNISKRTVQTHISRLVLKLHARNRISAVATYLRYYANQICYK